MSEKRYIYRGQEYRFCELARLAGVPKSTLAGRMARGMTVEEAVTYNYSHSVKLYNYHGELLTLKQISEKSKLSKNAIAERIHKGWSVEEAADLPVGSYANPKTGKPKRARPMCVPDKNSPWAERKCWNAALKIFYEIGTQAEEWNFQCITPAKEYAFEGDIISWNILFSSDQNTADLTARYKKCGINSAFRRRFQIIDDKVQEVETA